MVATTLPPAAGSRRRRAVRRAGVAAPHQDRRLPIRNSASHERGTRYDPPVDDHASVSFWLETAGDDLAPRPPLDGSTDADVAILGAGLTGLWTAYYLARRDPWLRIVVVEREIAGFGASGRNGAWCAPDLNISMDRLARLHGDDAARRMQQATYDAVDEVGRACAEAGIDAGFHKGGEIIVARGPQGVPVARGLAPGVRAVRVRRPVPAGGCARAWRTGSGSPGPCGPWSPTTRPSSTPAAWSRGLARAVEGMGVRIVEGTAVTAVRPRTRPAARPWSPRVARSARPSSSSPARRT